MRLSKNPGKLGDKRPYLLEIHAPSMEHEESLNVGPILIPPGKRLIDDQVFRQGNRNLDSRELHRRRVLQRLLLERKPGNADLHRSSCGFMSEEQNLALARELQRIPHTGHDALLGQGSEELQKLDIGPPDRGIHIHRQARHSSRDDRHSTDDHSRSTELPQRRGERRNGFEQNLVRGDGHGLPNAARTLAQRSRTSSSSRRSTSLFGTGQP